MLSVKTLGSVALWYGLLFGAIAGCYIGLFLYGCASAFLDFVGEHTEDFE